VPPPSHAPIPPIKKKIKKPLIFGIAGAGAAALILVLALLVIPLFQNNTNTDNPIDDDYVSIDINTDVEPPVVDDNDYHDGGVSYTTNDPNIRMIEVNQGISYGYDSDTGEFYLLNNFVAGKETALFIDLKEPFDPKSQVMLTIERDGEHVISLPSLELVDETTLLFQPKDIREVGFWEQGVYTFTFNMDDSEAVRTANFHKAMPMKVLAVPIKGNYYGEVRTCEGDWKLGATMISAVFPVAREDVEYVLGPEQDYSDPSYDLNTKDGRKKVWQSLCAMQTPNNDYTMIVGYMRTPTIQGYLGYTYGGEATIVCESEPDLLATVVHEMAHCYKIGDEYSGGSLNDEVNPPPYGMEGKDILTGEPAAGTKEYVEGGNTVGLLGSGSVIYPEQRPYWPEGRELLGTRTSYMGEGTGEDAFMFWTTSDIWNHLFTTFTGQPAQKGGYVAPEEEAEEGPGEQGEYWGPCPQCSVDMYDPDGYIECANCAGMVLLTDAATDECKDCGKVYSENDIYEDDLWIYHPTCGYLLYYPAFVEYYSYGTTIYGNKIALLEIRGSFDPSGAFNPEPWYSYESAYGIVATRRDGEYNASVYDSNGKRLSIAYFYVTDESQINTRAGYKWGAGEDEDNDIPIKVTVKIPDSAAKIVISKGGQEVYEKTLSANAPQVAFTKLTEGQKLDNHTTLTWQASDADGDELTYRIWYYRSEDEMYLVATDLTGNSYNADLTDYPGTDQGWFVILATDGSRTTAAMSPKVSVPFRAPDILNHIPDGTQYKVTDLIEIHGKVYDAQDGWLWFREYKWYIDGIYDSDYAFLNIWPYTMAPGIHTITMEVTNSAGMVSTKDFVIEILEYDLDLPDPWPKREITVALGQGYYQPLDRLDAPITRIEFAKMMFYFYMEGVVLSWDEDLPDDVEPENLGLMVEFSDMSNDIIDPDNTYAMQMMWLGLMELKNARYDDYGDFTMAYGEFDPHGTLTQREAMQIMYMAIELGRTQRYTTYEVLDESVFLPHLEEWGMFDESGFNSYNPNERMSKGLSMVRIARFLIYVHETIKGYPPDSLDPEWLYGY